MSFKVYFPTGAPRGAKLLVAAQLAKVPLEHVNIDYQDLKKDEHLKRHPLGKIPALETPEGPLFESNAILRFIARQNVQSGLYGFSSYQEAQVDQWLDFATTELEPLLVTLLYPVLGFMPQNPQQAGKNFQELLQKFKVLDAHFNGRNFTVGEQLTIADIQLVFVLMGAFNFVYGEKTRAALPHLDTWFDKVTSLPEFREHMGRPRKCKEPFQVLQVSHQEQKQKEQKPKGEQKPKEEKKKEEKPKKVEEDDGEEKKEKPKDPLELLPPSTFSVDDWKRRFLASKDWKAEFEWFWQNLDEQGWSCWLIYYEKAEGEGSMLLKTNNNMKGFLQRIDPHFKKWCFAIHGVYGEEPNLEIRGAWMWRGVEVPLVMKEHPTFEFCKFVKVTKDNKDLTAIFEQYWMNQTEDESVVEGLRARTLVYFR